MTAEERRILELALIGLETERNRIEQELSDIQQQLSGSRTSLSLPATISSPRLAPNKGKTMTAAQKRKISRAMKARWAARKRAKAA